MKQLAKYSLGEVTEILSGFAWSSSKFNRDYLGLPVIRIQNVTETVGGFVYWNHEYDNRYLIRTGDILLSLSGSFQLSVWSGPDALLNQRIVKLAPNEKFVDRHFFIHQIRTLLGSIQALGKHAIINNVSLADLKRIVLTLPALDEQKRIAAILDKVDALRVKRCQAIANLRKSP